MLNTDTKYRDIVQDTILKLNAYMEELNNLKNASEACSTALHNLYMSNDNRNYFEYSMEYKKLADNADICLKHINEALFKQYLLLE